MLDEKAREEAKKRQKEGWIESQFSFEVMGASPGIVEAALKDHIARMARAPDTYIYERDFGSIVKASNPPAGLKEAHSQIAKARLFAKDFYTLLNIIMVYGPSSVEILSPPKRDLKIDEMQNIANVVAGLMHEFAAKGAGGVLISSPQK
jgi:hypothetical protein